MVLEPVESDLEQVDGRQYLFNVRYSGPEGDGTLRLVLRLHTAEDFQLLAADTLGRSRWSLEMQDERSLLLDHRQKTFCRGGEELNLGEASLTVLPITMLPRVLLGEMPVSQRESDLEEGSVEFTDLEERRWSVRREEGELVAWTVWVREAPTLWWTRQNKGGILSHRDGSQFRWRRAVEEELEARLQIWPPPDDYVQVNCNEYDLPELRQDQSAPPGACP